MKQVLIVEAVRTAVGRMGGTLRDVQPDDLAAEVIREALRRTGVPPAEVSEVILGQTKQTTDAPNIARVAALKAGIPVDVPSYTVHRQCASAVQAINSAALQVATGISDVVIAGGVESMSTAPYYLRFARFGYEAGNGEILDPNTESQPKAQPEEVYGRLTMGMTAENLAEMYQISRQEQDEYALASQERAARAIAAGLFRNEITPYVIRTRKGDTVFDTDEHPRKTSLGSLAKLPPVFKKNGTVTAGNTCGRSDGASVLVVMNEERAREYELRPMARVVSHAAVGVRPDLMGIGPVPATRKALALAGLGLKDIDLIELNEPFAAQALACIRELELDADRVNVNGGAIALGHPVGASGAIITTKLLYEMRRRGCRYGLSTLCAGGGQGITVILESLVS